MRVGASFDALSNHERIERYRDLAAEALARAQDSATDEHRAAYLNIAASWAVLADEVERQARREADLAAMNAT